MLWTIHDTFLEEKSSNLSYKLRFSGKSFLILNYNKSLLAGEVSESSYTCSSGSVPYRAKNVFLAIFLASLDILVPTFKILRCSSSIYSWHNLKTDYGKRLLESFYKSLCMTVSSKTGMS